MSAENIKDKHGEEIQEGDVVGTRYRGGTREGAGNIPMLYGQLDTRVLQYCVPGVVSV